MVFNFFTTPVVSFVILFFSTSFAQAEETTSSNNLLNPLSYVRYIEDKIGWSESIDGVSPGYYGIKDGYLTIQEICNVGGQLIRTTEGFSNWSLQLYKQQLLTTHYYSALIGCASFPLYLENLSGPLHGVDQSLSNDFDVSFNQRKNDLGS